MATDTSRGRLPALDGLRALAVGLVVADHAAIRWTEGGGIGVAIFFVLSGYLITSLLVSERRKSGAIHYGLFYARRALRLWPALIAMLIVTELIGASWRAALLAGTYTTDLVDIANVNVSPYGHTWSLGVEEQFYLIWPLFLPLALRSARSLRKTVITLTALTVASVAACWVWTVHALHTTGTIGLGIFDPLLQGHGLLIGCLLALLGTKLRYRRPELAAFVGGLAILGVALAGAVFVDKHWDLWCNLAAELVAAAMIVALRDAKGGIFAWRPVVWVGTRSYAIYLWHLPLILLFSQHHVRHATVFALAATLVASELSARLVEAPFLKLKDRLHPGARRPTPVARHRAQPVPATE